MASHSGKNVVEVSTETITAIENVSKTAKLYPNKSRRLAERLKVFREHLSNASEKALTVLLDKHVFPPFIFLLKEVLTFLQRFTETQYLLKSYSSNIDPERFFDLTTKLVEFYDVFGIGGKSDTKAIVLEDAQDKKEDDSHHLKVLEGLKADNAKAVLGGLETQEARVVEALTSSAVIDAREIDQLRAKIKAIDTDFDNYGGSIEEDSNSVDMTTLECDRTHVQKIGEGKFGIVFKGQLFGAEVAVKYLRDAVIPVDRQLIIRKEIAKLHLLKHDNIVKYYGAQTKSTPFFFVFEKIFCSLYSALYARDENEKLDLFKTNYRRKLEILIDCGRAIEYLHSVNVLYRNIKSTNILITSNGVAKICDFSFAMSKQDLSSLLGVASVRASITGTGTNLSAQKVFPAYLAPEIILSSNKDPVEYNVYTDVYAFGILINEVLTHTPPFPGLTFRNIMNKLQKSDNNRPMLFAHNYRAENQGNALILELRSLVERSWATNPLERPSFTHIVLILERIVLYADALASFTTVTEVSKSSVPSLDETNIGQSSFNARKSFYQRSGGNDNAESMYDMSNDANDLSFSRDAGDTSPVKTNKIATIIESYEKGFIATASVERERPHDRSFERSMDYGDANSQPSVFVKLYDKFEKSMDRPSDAVDKSRSFDRSRSDNRVSISKSVSMDRRTLHGVFEPTLEVEGSASNDRSDISSVNPAAEPNHSETPIEVKSIGIAIEHAVSIDSKATDESMNISKSNDSGVPADGAVGAKVAFSTTNYMEVNHTRTLDSYDSNAPRNIHIEKSHQSLDSFTQLEKSEEPVEYLGTQSVESISVESDPEYTHSKYIAQLFYDAGSCGKKDSQTKLEELAAQNDLLALGFLMGMLCYGSGMPKDVKKANDIAQRIYPLILQRADDESDSSRKFYQYIAGLCYEQGVGLEKNDFLAVKYYQMSADQGYAAALSNLGYCYKHGQGVKEDRYEAVRLYGLGADQNHATSLNNLGYCYQHGYGVQKDLQEAVRLYKRSADQGHSTAQNNLGYCYQYGQGCEKNLAEAVRLYEQSASQGCSFGQNSLGHCYKRGHGVPKDYAKAVYYYRLSAEQGHATAQNNLGYCYQYGQGVEVNYGEAVRWYKLSVEQGQASAENNLGFCYQCGIGVKKDLAEAVRLYKSSAEKGYAVAMYNLGLCYLNGMGVPNDPEKAVQLIRSSAEQGHTAGQVKLAMCYEEGVGVVKDTREAIRWYVMAARRGDETAMKALKRIHG